ncbi:MAG: tetratricopeptide repeat protein [Gammaproteobacteria bacterium]|nr:tetratricopeptide repeat protein [Gammaproteobacteria bacterium]NND53821.1 tetratricopeptide repeat protein [Gammaproteobacteria bacterium]
MPTESTFLLAGLFFLAAALGYYFAVSGDDEERIDRTPAGRLNADYIKGLNYLLEEKPDQALEVFTRMVEVDDETLETHFAMGSLFRRRGEIDRAIKVHQNIIARENIGAMHREQAMVSLAEDYLSAGLLDRAEELFGQLTDSEDHGIYARRKLVRIYEVTQEWEHAVKGFKELESIDPRAAEESRVAHYYCELAESAYADGEAGLAHKLLDQADKASSPSLRSQLLRADIRRQSGEHKQAIELYGQIMDKAPKLIGAVVPHLAESCRETGEQGHLSESLEKLLESDPQAGRAIGLAAVYDPRIVNETALRCLRDFVLGDPVLTNLVDMSGLQADDSEAQNAALERIRNGLTNVISKGHRYQCRECGYVSSDLLWQCPSCRGWESVLPSVQLNFSSLVR